jgi:hypothetical protein
MYYHDIEHTLTEISMITLGETLIKQKQQDVHFSMQLEAGGALGRHVISK